jgi:hypothetical protein
MITKFDSLFAGHIDMDDVGYGGTAVNDRRFSNERLATVFDKAIDKGGVLCGSPEQIVEHLKKLEASYPGLDRISVSLSVGVPRTVALEQLERFATEVMPAFKTAVAEPAVAD